MNSFTLAISIDAPPEAVLNVLGDPLQVPRWAPGFARSVRPDGSGAGWIVTSDRGEAHRHIPVSRERGTVDFLEAPGAHRGLFARVVANGDGSDLAFTLVGDDSPEQRQVLADELAALKHLCEA